MRFLSLFSVSSFARMSSELSGVRSSWLMFARNSLLYFELSASCSAFSSSATRAASTSRFFCSTFAFCSASSDAFSSSSSLTCCSSSCCSLSSSSDWRSVLRLRLELGVRALELFLLLLQLLRLALQLLRQLLRLLEQLLGAHVRLNHVQHDADRFGELVEEGLVDLAERQEARELDHRLHFALEQDGQDDDVARRRFAEARRDLDVVVGNVLQQNRLLLERRLADESFARARSDSPTCLRARYA